MYLPPKPSPRLNMAMVPPPGALPAGARASSLSLPCGDNAGDASCDGGTSESRG